MNVMRPIGTETEFGVVDPSSPRANAFVLSTRAVAAYDDVPANPRAGHEPVAWSFAGEDPLADMRGWHLARAAAAPSQLTDDPHVAAPAGPGGQAAELDDDGGIWRARRKLPRPASCVLANGGRYYVDHAHPEYSAPEALGPAQAVLYDRAGEVIARRVMRRLRDEGADALVLYKNNCDGKGASYGAHENYLVRREVDFSLLAEALQPFFVTRPVICGAGRVGIGQRSEEPGFQVSQRADYIENTVGLETTFNRPLVNTRDEPHADAAKWRRLHVICGDANLFDVSSYLRLGTTAALLWYLENCDPAPLLRLAPAADAVAETWNVSHDPYLRYRIATKAGEELTAVQIQRRYLEIIGAAMTHPDEDARRLLTRWSNVLDLLGSTPMEAADQVEWVAKYQLLDAMRQRVGAGWEHPKVRAMDLQWADLRSERSLVASLAGAGRVERMFSAAQVEAAADEPPAGTRALLRGRAVAAFPQLVAAAWTQMVFDLGDRGYRRVEIQDPMDAGCKGQLETLERGDAAGFVAASRPTNMA